MTRMISVAFVALTTLLSGVNGWLFQSPKQPVVVLRPRSRFHTIKPLLVMTEPDRAKELEQASDYFLQTEDFAANSHAPEMDSSSPQLLNGDHEQETVEIITTGDNMRLKLPRRFQPTVAWEHHHHATLNLVHEMRSRRLPPLKMPGGTSSNGGSVIETNIVSSAQPHDENGVKESELIDTTATSLPQSAADNNSFEKNSGKLEATEAANKINQKNKQVTAEEEPKPQRDNIVQSLWNSIVNRPKLVSECSEWKRLQRHSEHVKMQHLRDLLQDQDRSDYMYATHDGVYLDYSRQQVTVGTMKFLFELADKQDLKGKIEAMMGGDKINFTEKRAVLHTALRAPKSDIGTIMVDGMDVVAEVHDVLDQIKKFTDDVRSGNILGYTGKRLRNIVSVGIGGSYLGPEFLHECLKTEPQGVNSALGYSLRFLANVDPVDVERTCADLDPEETLVVVVSKTFTTSETMLNAKTMRQWLWDFMGNDREVVRKHMVACASLSSLDKVKEFGIDTENRFFRFWDFVGGRYSVCSAAGAVPIALLYGYELFEKFLKGARSMDEHFATAPYHKNIPVLMGLLGVWNMSFMKYKSRTTLPYAEALLKLPAHIQQLDMESNGKSMTKQGLEVDYPVGEIDFGEAGTNGQHSFYQLLHMGQTVPCDFIGFVQSQHDFCVEGEDLSSHDELMANFFAQPDALANGKTEEEVRAEGVSEELIPHRVFKGNRPSLSLLLPKLTAYACGQLLAIYEHRTAVQGFMWDINSFDQWGVELGKKLALDIKTHMRKGRNSEDGEVVQTSNPATTRLLNYYLRNSESACNPETESHNSMTRVTRKTHREHHCLPPLQHDLGKHGSRLS